MSQVLLPSNQAAAAAASSTSEFGDIKQILNSTGPVVNAVLLSATKGTQSIQVDTTPQKQMVQSILGGAFTFLGQYEDEGVVLMIRKDQGEDLPVNTHKLQPPFRDTTVRGDILVLKVAAEDDENAVSKSNDEFFLNYSVDEYVKFAARTDVVAPVVSMEDDDDDEDIEEDDEEEDDDDEMEGEDDSEDEDEAGGFMALLMENVMQRFQQENGRMPDEEELKALEAAISQKLGGGMAEEE